MLPKNLTTLITMTKYVADTENKLPEVERVPLKEAVGRVCGEDLRAVNTLPVFRTSGCDGIAVESGRFVVAAAKTARHVVGTDISGQMLLYGERYAKEEGVENTSFVEADLKEADLDALGWRKRFDLVFAAITPAITGEGLEKMMEMSRGGRQRPALPGQPLRTSSIGYGGGECFIGTVGTVTGCLELLLQSLLCAPFWSSRLYEISITKVL